MNVNQAPGGHNVRKACPPQAREKRETRLELATLCLGSI
jgi:hypothetical protein